MKAIVEKVFQSPSTPVYEIAYLVKIEDYHIQDSEELQNLVRKLEDLNLEHLGLKK